MKKTCRTYFEAKPPKWTSSNLEYGGLSVRKAMNGGSAAYTTLVGSQIFHSLTMAATITRLPIIKRS
jgi:hypothetical protein